MSTLNEASTTLLRWLRDVGPAHGDQVPRRLRSKLRNLERDGAIAYSPASGWWCTTLGEALIGGAA